MANDPPRKTHTTSVGVVTHLLGTHALWRNWQKRIARSNDPLFWGRDPPIGSPPASKKLAKKDDFFCHITSFLGNHCTLKRPPTFGVVTHQLGTHLVRRIFQKKMTVICPHWSLLENQRTLRRPPCRGRLWGRDPPTGETPPLADEATRQQRRMRGLGVAEAFGQSFWFWFRFWLTDERSDERVVFLLDETPEGGQVIDVAVGVGQQQLGTHLQLHLDAFAQQRLRKPSVRFFFGQILAPIPYPAKGIPK